MLVPQKVPCENNGPVDRKQNLQSSRKSPIDTRGLPPSSRAVAAADGRACTDDVGRRCRTRGMRGYPSPCADSSTACPKVDAHHTMARDPVATRPCDMEPDLRGRRAAAEQAHRWPEREARTSYAGTPARRSHAPRRWAVSSRGYLGVSHSERARTQRCTRCATASPGMASPIRYEAYGSVLYAASKTGGIVLATVCWHKRDDGAPSSVSGRPLASDATRGCSHTVVVTAGRPCHAATLSLCRTCPRMHPGGPAAAPQACVDPPGKRGPP